MHCINILTVDTHTKCIELRLRYIAGISKSGLRVNTGQSSLQFGLRHSMHIHLLLELELLHMVRSDNKELVETNTSYYSSQFILKSMLC